MKNISASNSEGFRINLQIIIDELGIDCGDTIFHDKTVGPAGSGSRLNGPRIYSGQPVLDKNYVYLTRDSHLPDPGHLDGVPFIVLGNLPAAYLETASSFVVIRRPVDMDLLFERIQDIFEKNHRWDERLQYALNHDLGIAELCRISVEYFQNPLFIHDAHFHIIECPIRTKGMTNWEKDERTGLDMVPLDLINDFKVDPEYLDTLKTTGAHMFSENLRGYRILYVNIWGDQGRYEGRLCIDELHTPLKPGQFLAAEHLVRMVQIALRRRNLTAGSFSRPIEHLIEDVLERRIADGQAIERELGFCGWGMEDRYLCVKILIERRHIDSMALISTCNFIEANIAGSYAFQYKNDIVCVINLTEGGIDSAKCLTQLAYIIREGLFKAGASNICRDFSQLAYFYRQAEIALEYGSAKNSTVWCHHFSDYVLPYILDHGCLEMPPGLVCAQGLFKLRRYDKANETELYKTLAVFLRNERHATKTAQELYIHRSTLFYRLDRIHDLIQQDLDDPKVRLYLNLSLYILME